MDTLTPANRIREVRLSRGLTKTQLAVKLGTSPSVVSGYEDESRSLRMPTARRVAAALGVSVTDLLPLLDRAEVIK